MVEVTSPHWARWSGATQVLPAMLAAAGLIVLTAFGVDANHATPVKTVAAPGVTLMDDCTDDSATDDSDDLAQ